MKNNMDNKGVYLAALAEASEELKRIAEEIERLDLRQTCVEKVVEVLERKIGPEPQFPIQLVRRNSQILGLNLTTRLSVIHTGSKPKEPYRARG